MPRLHASTRTARRLGLVAVVLAGGMSATPLAARILTGDEDLARYEFSDHAHRPPTTSAAIRARVARREAVANDRRRGLRAMDTAMDAQIGRWDTPDNMMVSGINAILLPTGRVLFFANDAVRDAAENGADAWTWNPADDTWHHVPPPPAEDGQPINIWCGGHSFLPDGRLVVAGGNMRYPVGDGRPANGNGYKGLDRVFTFDPITETWTEQPRMRHGRWYPTLTTLSDGRVVILGGLDETGYEGRNTDLEVFTPSPRRDGVGTITLQPTASRRTQIYPHIFTLPGDRVVLAGPNSGDTAILDTTTWRWTSYPSIPRNRLWGAAVLEPYDGATGPGALTLIGGFDSNLSPTADTKNYRLDLSNPRAGWTESPSLNTGRAHVNATFLADGTLMVVGGGAGVGNPGGQYVGPVYTAELREPDGTMRQVPGQTVRRTYHSTSFLLPDGRLVSTGDDKDGVIRPMEIYSPPYMFRGDRPQITAAPARIDYGTTFTLSTSAPVGRVQLIAPSSVTHATDMNQRVIRLAHTQDGASVQVSAPASVGTAPRGYYMLVVVSADGVPSPARWVQVGGTDLASPPPPPPGGTTTTTTTTTSPPPGTTTTTTTAPPPAGTTTTTTTAPPAGTTTTTTAPPPGTTTTAPPAASTTTTSPPAPPAGTTTTGPGGAPATTTTLAAPPAADPIAPAPATTTAPATPAPAAPAMVEGAGATPAGGDPGRAAAAPAGEGSGQTARAASATTLRARVPVGIVRAQLIRAAGRHRLVVQVAGAGVLRVRVDTPRVHRAVCVVRATAAGRYRCAIAHRLAPGDRVQVRFRDARGDTTARVLSPPQ